MLRFVINKMLNKRWMVLSLLIGNILLIAIACMNPMYTHAVLQRMLTRSLSDYMDENNRYPGMISVNASLSVRNDDYLNEQEYLEAYAAYDNAAELYGVPEIMRAEHYYMPNVSAEYEVLRNEKRKTVSAQLGTLRGIEDHSTIVGGRMFSSEPDEEGCIEVIISQNGMARMDLLLDEKLTLQRYTWPDGTPMRVKIVGVFKNSEPNDIYWVRSPTAYPSELFLAYDLYERLFIKPEGQKYTFTAQLYCMLDYEQMRGDRAQQLFDTAKAQVDKYSSSHAIYYTASFYNTLEAHLIKARQVDTTLLVLQIPILVLVAAFIFMVSRQMLEMEQNEITILKSRGAARRQIINVYFVQSTGVAIISFIIAMPLCAWLCQVLGSANAFLEFVRRKALTVEFTPTVLLYGLAAALFSVLVMVLPVVRYSNLSIVAHKQRKTRRSEKPLWQKLYLDVVVLGISLYGLYSFGNQKEILAQRVIDGMSLDPLLFLSSSLFMVGASLVMLRIIPAITWLIFKAGQKLWSPALYASFLRVLRARNSHTFIMVFLMLTIALGIFNARTARTVNNSAEEQTRYSMGADLVLQEKWEDNSQQLADSGGSSEDIVYYEPDFGKYLNIDGVESVTRVYVTDNGLVSQSGKSIKNVRVMGITSDEFGRTAWMKNGLLPRHWYEYLNAIAVNSRAILVSSNFRDLQGFKLGDVINYRAGTNKSMRGVIYGFVDYWPGYLPVVQQKGSDGLLKETQNYLIVANLTQIQAVDDIRPYKVWIKLTGSSQVMYDYIEERGIPLVSFKDTSAQLITRKNDPIFQGTNGILTVGYIVVLILCTAGFLIYWILSIQSRSLQFGIYRAMGMSMREIISLLLTEQLFISGTSILAGTFIGIYAAKLYIPLIQIAYTSADNVLPLEIAAESEDMSRLFGITGVVIFVCMIVLGITISRIKIAQALKLGED